MADGGGGATGSSSSGAPLDGAFLLQLLRNPPQSQSQSQSQSHQQQLPHETLNPHHHHHHRGSAIAAVGPTYPIAPRTSLRPPTHHHQETLQHLSPPPSSFPPGFSSRDHHQQHRGPPPGFSGGSPPVPRGGDFLANPPIHPGDGARARGRVASDSSLVESSSYAHRQQQRPPNSMRLEQHDPSHYHVEPPGNHRNMAVQRMMLAERGRTPGGVHNHHRAPPPPEWVPLQPNADRIRERDQANGQSSSLQLLGGRYGDGSNAQRASHHHHPNKQFHQSGGGGMGRSYSSAQDSDRDSEQRGDLGSSRSGSRESDGFCDQLEETLTLSEDATESSVERHSKSSRVKDIRLDLFRGHYVSSQRVRIRKRELECRYDIDSLTPLFHTIYKSLIPADEEKGRQKQLLLSLGKLVNKEWPNAQLHLYGSCANSFGVSNSDIDICLAIDESNMSKSEILLKLAEILESDNLQNVQALTHARVPIVKMMDPITGISCDICINNLLAVANTKLLRDYAQIDDRLRQLAFIVKHWAKSRGVNETYRGTLSSYAYVIMCIHFLQQRKPAILPCLQEMEATYIVNVDGIQCAYFDQVDRLRNFGAQNNESISRLLWGFFHYWAYYHDYTNDVISVRAGRNISKRTKDWTRRIGNDRHLICIEDPFETSHDLGRVVDKYSIKILREEFERAADVLQYDPNPNVTLFEPYIPRSLPNGLQSD